MIEIETSEEGWGDGDWEGLAARAVRSAIAHSPYTFLAGLRLGVEVSVKFAEDEEVRTLNASFRGKDKATNVLSFPMVQRDLIEALENGETDGEALLGDIILARGVCAAEAAEKGVTVATHATHLVVHGTFHLLGFDHENDIDGEQMEQLERDALAALGIADPYAVTES
ncbi:MAG: rRNA maturation RNase YbeY [Sphingomonas bacterium]|jgi:probable rRNA maturation factor|nr:rRNA maturation RNase YbeY [Sphingomonas bacterium]MDB5689189.1 rRNA maturation RNase YbeY [Sphingomonas bacterium]